ncbi:uncharacterized protein TM35_000371450 [Trypanosoma theileri]|uniref:Uncharacterized protein n=1 Tax=Trypanosoma theileri TaxID=67003 RepID=A0A1X0NK89_9TRYP|nr:uncharacterized protein TM35_000371450 [Trypanosoma theileri]ORC85172.1 hypothetical protein TM35_000371450 [Trypanosoma theileri]
MERVTFSILHRKLAFVNFDGWDAVTEEDVYKGVPRCYAMFMRTFLFSFPRATAALMRKYPWFCIEAEDASLGQAVLRLLGQELGHKPSLTPMQFIAPKYASTKMKACIELFDLLSGWETREKDREASHTIMGGAMAQKKEPHLITQDSFSHHLERELNHINQRKKALDRITRV